MASFPPHGPQGFRFLPSWKALHLPGLQRPLQTDKREKRVEKAHSLLIHLDPGVTHHFCSYSTGKSKSSGPTEMTRVPRNISG